MGNLLVRYESMTFNYGPVRVHALAYPAESGTFQVECRFGAEEWKKEGFITLTDAFGYGVNWVQEKVEDTKIALRMVYDEAHNA